ncbi:hypothetical protein [Bacillus litorisediminis]|uniref:hypothetical protein n=1 Tax=Bacillus litorisediminis TaxID=2922713 RepID=UPI001FAE2AEF|nr:hypothetical protein [Bacillus litorisediminis]
MSDEAKENEILHIWQPSTFLKGKNPSQMVLVEVIRGNNHLKILFEDTFDNQVEIIYDQLMQPMEYFVWAFRHSTETGRYGLRFKEINDSGLISPDSPYFFKVSNSEFIKWFDDQNPLFNSKTYPNLEHHLYITGDEVFDVLSTYEPKIIEKNKSDLTT